MIDGFLNILSDSGQLRVRLEKLILHFLVSLLQCSNTVTHLSKQTFQCLKSPLYQRQLFRNRTFVRYYIYYGVLRTWMQYMPWLW